MHFFQSKMQTPMLVPGGPKGIHEHASVALHVAAGSEVQLTPDLEHCSIGIGTSSIGMHQPGDVAFMAGPHHWQHFLASHSSAVATVQLRFGAGGTGAAIALFLCLRASRFSAADLCVATEADGVGGGLQVSQSYMHMPPAALPGTDEL